MDLKPRILFAIPTAGGVEAMTSAAAARMAVAENVDYICTIGVPHDYNRNSIVRAFLAAPVYSHLFMLDSDINPPLDAIDRLLALDVPLASGLYPILQDGGLRWAAGEFDDKDKVTLKKTLESTEPFDCSAVGAGCLMIRRDVFEDVGWPWFRWHERSDGYQMGEDMWFSKKCKQANLRFVVDPMVLCDHVKKVGLLRFAQRS